VRVTDPLGLGLPVSAGQRNKDDARRYFRHHAAESGLREAATALPSTRARPGGGWLGGAAAEAHRATSAPDSSNGRSREFTPAQFSRRRRSACQVLTIYYLHPREIEHRRLNMKSFIIAALAASTILAGGVSPAAAHDYPYCLQGRTWGYPGNCEFTSYQQCLASASGTDAYCGINPRVAFAQQGRQRYQGRQRF
jgi:hypothetical protein